MRQPSRSKQQYRRRSVTQLRSRSSVRPVKRYRLRWGIILMCATLLGFGTGSVFSGALSLMPLHKGNPLAMAARSKIPMQLTRPVNILVMGVDKTDKNSETGLNGNSDTMLLVQFQPNPGLVKALSLPRDTLVDIPGYGTDKLNAANVYGGPELTARTVHQLLNGIQLDRYVRIDTQGLIKLVDAMGGVEVNIPKPMHYRDRTQNLEINFEPGKQWLSGQKLQEYLRFRHDELGDIGRVQRQQEVLKNLKQQFLQPATILKMPQILHVAQQSIDTNLSMGELFALIGFLQANQGAALQTVTLPGRFSEPGEYSRSYWITDSVEVEKTLVQQFR